MTGLVIFVVHLLIVRVWQQIDADQTNKDGPPILNTYVVDYHYQKVKNNARTS